MNLTSSKKQWLIWALVAVALALLPFLFKNFRVFQFNMVMVYAIAILGLNILTGFNGQISLGHGAFYAIGAYVAAMLMDTGGWPYWATLAPAGALCFVFGFLMGFPALRLAGHYLALATFALALAVPQLLKYKGIEVACRASCFPSQQLRSSSVCLARA
jgi:branched-chain amino acid transport system permease protein